jgi:hypothetical protein
MSGVVDWFIVGKEEIHLITQVLGIVVVTDWFTLAKKFGKVFDLIKQPFKTSTWYFFIFLFIRIRGIVSNVHEYGRPGSIYQGWRDRSR